jgi:hypothetical protein
MLFLPSQSTEKLEEIARSVISINNSEIFLQNAIAKVKELQDKEKSQKDTIGCTTPLGYKEN